MKVQKEHLERCSLQVSVILSNERLLNCDALRTFLRPGWKVWVSVGLKQHNIKDFKNDIY